MEFTIRQRRIQCTNEELIGDNADYEASFSFDSEWDGCIKTARFIHGGRYAERVLTDDKCIIPVEVLKQGFLKVGVYSAEMTTTYCEVYIRASIKETTGTTAEPTPDVYAQIIKRIEDMETGGVSDEQIAKAVEDYLAENPIGAIDEAVIAEAVNDYMKENPIEDSLSGKRIICVGDSICEGVGANNQPYAYWIQQWHPTAEVINLGVGGMTIAQKDSSITNAMPVRIASGEFEAYENIDIVVLEGGINDLMNNVKLGYIQKSYGITKYNTFCRGMEYMFNYFKGLYPNARMIFMSTHNVTAYDYNKGQAWWGAASEICAKWGVEFLDLFGLICTAKVAGLQLHPDYAVHRDYYAKYLNMALTSDTPLAGAKTTNYYKHNVPMLLQYYSGTKTFSVGDSVSTSDWRINMVRGDLTTYVNVSASVTYDMSDVDTKTPGVYPVHVAYTEDGITISTDVNVTIESAGETTKVLDSISATKTKTEFVVGDVVNTDDIVVKAHYTDGTDADVTSNANIDTSNANMTASGEYNIAISYTEENVTKTVQIQISVVEESGGDIPDVPDTPDETTWEDTTTIDRAWNTNGGVFSNTTITERYTEGATYNISCKLMVESDSATSGQVILRMSGITHDLGTIAFGETIEVNAQMKANTGWTLGNMQPSVYTTSGSGFPWTAYIKDFAITSV